MKRGGTIIHISLIHRLFFPCGPIISLFHGNECLAGWLEILSAHFQRQNPNWANTNREKKITITMFMTIICLNREFESLIKLFNSIKSDLTSLVITPFCSWLLTRAVWLPHPSVSVVVWLPACLFLCQPFFSANHSNFLNLLANFS